MFKHKSIFLFAFFVFLLFSATSCSDTLGSDTLVTIAPTYTPRPNPTNTPVPTPALLPDFVIRRIIIDPLPFNDPAYSAPIVLREQKYSISAEIENIGDAKYDGWIPVDFDYFCGGSGFGPIDLDFPSLDVNERKITEQRIITVGSVGGTCLFRYEVDSDNFIEEKNDNPANNKREENLWVP